MKKDRTYQQYIIVKKKALRMDNDIRRVVFLVQLFIVLLKLLEIY